MIGDRLIAVDGTPVGSLSGQFELRRRLVGRLGTSLGLTFRRCGQEGEETEYDVNLVRSVVRRQTRLDVDNVFDVQKCSTSKQTSTSNNCSTSKNVSEIVRRRKNV